MIVKYILNIVLCIEYCSKICLIHCLAQLIINQQKLVWDGFDSRGVVCQTKWAWRCQCPPCCCTWLGTTCPPPPLRSLAAPSPCSASPLRPSCRTWRSHSCRLSPGTWSHWLPPFCVLRGGVLLGFLLQLPLSDPFLLQRRRLFPFKELLFYFLELWHRLEEEGDDACKLVGGHIGWRFPAA